MKRRAARNDLQSINSRLLAVIQHRGTYRSMTIEISLLLECLVHYELEYVAVLPKSLLSLTLAMEVDFGQMFDFLHIVQLRVDHVYQSSIFHISILCLKVFIRGDREGVRLVKVEHRLKPEFFSQQNIVSE